MEEAFALSVSAAFRPGRAIRHGWAALKRQPAALLIGAFLLQCTEGGGGGGGGGGGSSGGSGDGGSSSSSASETAASLRGGVEQAVGDLQAWLAHPTASPALSPTFAAGIPGSAEVGVVAAVLIGLLCLGIVLFGVWLFRAWLMTGYIRLHESLVIEGQGDFSLLFGGGDGVWRMAGYTLLRALVIAGALAVAALPGLLLVAAGFSSGSDILQAAGAGVALIFAIPVMVYVQLGLSLGQHAVALEEMTATDALSRSWQLADGNRGDLFVYYLATGLFNLAGILLCCVGIIPARAIVDVGTTEAYLMITRSDWEGFRLVQELGSD